MRSPRFTWDPAKNRLNLAKHGIAFEDVVSMFDGPRAERQDDRFDYGEIRNVAIGLANGHETTVIYTVNDDGQIRIISAWRSIEG
ncbi:BrnT family toxin [Vineibacter terrae]|uniref:BrnT family toxin n=1 Tax=Vineibacter terrae TaxID=2586908 RepID=A0A5C8PB04_9HYPH|nr:BrnT family toxin [Vineibacter terrae]TXL70734.1 BrnT family toxin [Vineibacter terrae]